MRRYLIQGLMENLKIWIDIESNSMYRKLYVGYLTNYRLKKGIELLETTDKTISEICFEVGFSSASYFAETFRKNYGCTPTEYRRIFPKNNHLANT